jgi:hypothetical protein
VNPALTNTLRTPAIALAAAGAALVAGAAAAAAPPLVLAAALGALAVALTFRAPAVHLTLLVAVAVMTPPEILNRFSLGGGLGAAGLTVPDLLLLVGLARVAFELPYERLDGRRMLLVGGVLAFLAVALIELRRGMSAYPLADAVAEFRVLLGVAAALVVLPILARARSTSALWTGLVIVGLALGTWGILQWVLHLRFEDASLAVVGSRFATAGRVAGLYAFPVAIVLGTAALMSGHVERWSARLALFLVVTLNTAALVLTFQRSFWIAIGGGLLVLIAFGGWPQRIRLLVGVPTLLLLVVGTMALTAPTELQAARERVASLSAYRTDPSVQYRKAENRVVRQRIAERPLTGWGLGASLLIGRPGTTVVVKPRRYAESGYLWLAWKLGIPGAGLLCALLLAAALLRRPEPRTLHGCVRLGAQAALVTVAISAVAFAPFNSIAGTTMVGVLMAIAVSPLDFGHAREPHG